MNPSVGQKLSQEEEEILEGIKDCMVESVGLGREEITLDSSFYHDLGLKSLDLEDILFRLEERLGVRTPNMPEIRKFMMGDIPEDDFFDDDGLLTPKGLEHLKQLLPQRGPQEIKEEIGEFTLPSAFIVRHLMGLIAAQKHAE